MTPSALPRLWTVPGHGKLPSALSRMSHQARIATESHCVMSRTRSTNRLTSRCSVNTGSRSAVRQVTLADRTLDEFPRSTWHDWLLARGTPPANLCQ